MKDAMVGNNLPLILYILQHFYVNRPTQKLT